MAEKVYESLKKKYPVKALKKLFPEAIKENLKESSDSTLDSYYRYFKELEDYIYEFRSKPKLFIPVMKGLDAEQSKRSPKYSISDAESSLEYMERIIDLFERYVEKLTKKDQQELSKKLGRIQYKNFAQFVEKVYDTIADFLSRRSG